MKIVSIVEGRGELDAVPLLLRRLRDHCGAYDLEFTPAILRHRSQLVLKDALKIAVRLALLKDECDAILILFDGDDDCPKDLVGQIETWAREEAGNVPCAVVIAHREYESWFLGSIESLRGRRGIRADAVYNREPESRRNAKGEVESLMIEGATYAPTVDQAKLTNDLNFELAFKRCRSFRRMVSAFKRLALGAGCVIENWPPADWRVDG